MSQGADGQITRSDGKAGPNLAVLFAVVTLALFLQSLDTTIVATALHAIQTDLHTSVNWAGWTITVYAFATVVMLPVAARLSDRVGRKRVFLVSVAGFAVASLMCGLATNIHVLIVMRAIQAASGAAFTPCATGIVVDTFGQARDRAVGLFGSAFQVGAITGPVLGGVFVAFLSWQWIFFVNVPIGVMLLLVGGKVIPPDSRASGGRRASWDAVGMAVLALAILTGMIGATLLGEPGTRSVTAGVLTLTASAVLIGCFLRHVRRTRDPFVSPQLIHGRGFGAVNIINFLFGGATVGVISLIPLYATTRYHMGALTAGSVLAAQAVAAIATSALAALTLRRTGYRSPLLVGALLTAAGFFALAVGPQGDISAYAWLSSAACLIGCGTGWANPASRNAGLHLLPERAAPIAALRTMSRRIGTVAAVSLMTAAITTTRSPALAHALGMAVFGAVTLLATPVIARVPEHKGAW